MKKTIALVLILSLFLPCANVFAAAPTVSFNIDGKPYVTPKGEPAPYVNRDNRTMVPVRFFANALGVEGKNIRWDSQTNTATIVHGENSVQVQLGKRFVLVNGKQVQMDTVAESKNGRVFIPARFVVEGLGAYIAYDSRTSAVYISSTGPVELPSDELELPGNEVFDRPDLYDRVSKEYFKVADDKLLFLNRKKNTMEYELEKTLNPYINEQVYRATKALITDDNFVHVSYAPGDKVVPEPIVYLAFSANRGFYNNNDHQFQYLFFENIPYNARKDWQREEFSDKVAISLNLGPLWDPRNFVPGQLTDEVYEEKFRDSLMAIFGKSVGQQIYDFAMEKYFWIRDGNTGKSVYTTKRFGNIQMDYVFEGTGDQKFYFSYVNE